MHPTIYHCMNRVWTREELCADAEAAGQDPVAPSIAQRAWGHSRAKRRSAR